jgi:hypothetical protein
MINQPLYDEIKGGKYEQQDEIPADQREHGKTPPSVF